MAFMPWMVSWAFLLMVIATLAIYRKVVARQEDDFLHVSSPSTQVIANQSTIARKLDVIDRWGIALTAVAALWGIVMGAAYLQQAWHESLKFSLQ